MRARLSMLWWVLPLAAGPVAWAQLSEAEMSALESRLPAAASEPIDFQTQVQPIFDQACLRCHGPERPKAQFRLDAREQALKGGSSGVAILPGQSSRSPLVYLVARLVEDLEMPPVDKGEPLSAEQVGVLRAWIDQGANWSGATNTSRIAFSVAPMVQWFTVKGNERQFREHTGLKEGWNGGAQHFQLEHRSGDNRLSLEGRILANPEEYRLRLEVSRRDLGFAKFGFEQYREYYSDAGGYHPNLIPPSYQLDRDLSLEVGRTWADFGLTLPDWPRMVLGYEFRYRDGTKSILQWGDVGTVPPDFDPFGTDSKKIFPAAKQIDERVHILKFDLAHELAGVGIENQFRAEWYDHQSQRETVGIYDLTRSGFDKNFQAREGYEHFQASDAFRLEKQVVDWLFLSGGYFFSRLDGNYSLNANPVFPTGDYFSWDRYYSAQSVILEQNTHVFNANAQLGPWAGFTAYAGVQSEWMSQRGFGDVDIFEGFPESLSDPAFARTLPAFIDSNLDRAVVAEHIGARYTALPFTVLFAEGRFAQESIGQTETRTGDTVDFLRDTDASSQLEEGRVGFTVSPWTRMSLTTQYKRRHKTAAYHHLIDEDVRRTAEGYSAFITGRQSRLNELSAKLSVRAAKSLKLGLTFQLVTSDFENETMPIVEGFPGETIGGRVYPANYDAQIYSANVAWTPWHRLHLASTFSYRHTRSGTGHAIEPVVVSYEGDLYSSISSATFFLNGKTDLIAGYTYSWADFGQGNDQAGLPLGLVYDWHMVSAGVRRRLRKNISTNLQYRFYGFDQERTGGYQNYTAHGVLAALTMKLE